MTTRMARHYFEFLPDVDYDMGRQGIKQSCKDITRRFRVLELLKNRNVIYRTYYVVADESPDVVAQKVYGDSKLDWLILLTNNVIDPFFQWPLDHWTFTRHIKKKYGSLSVATQTVYHYEWIVEAESTAADGTVLPERVLVVDKTTHDALPVTDRRTISLFDQEKKLNDARKTIRYIDRAYLPQIIREAEGVFA